MAGLRSVLGTVLICWLLAAPSALTAGVDATAALCDRAARVAAVETGVPLDVLRAITRTETGRQRNGQLTPWPWTVNAGGKGQYFASPDAAQTAAFQLIKSGRQSFDVGCFQINFRWHGDAFGSLDEMLQPEANALYAARFLSVLHRETGSWPAAAAAYHSRTPKYAERYRARFEAIRAGLSPDATGPRPRRAFLAPRRALPGLRAVSIAPKAGAGSLVPMPAETGN